MHVTIVGGGFGGVKAALEISKNRKSHVTLITDKKDFQYYPALYSAATGGSHLEAWVPLTEIFGNRDNVDIIIDSITSIDKTVQTITGTSGTQYPYKTLILAMGAITTYFGIKGLDEYSYGIKSAEEIEHLKQHLLEEFSKPHSADKNFLVVGAGPTGVELAGALGTYLRNLQRHYHQPEPKIVISLIEAAPRILPRMSEKASKRVKRRLKRLGVRVETNKKVESATVDTLVVSGKPVKSHTVIWTSGVANHPFFTANPDKFELAKNGKVIVDEYMRTDKNIYVLGDNAATKFSGLAQTALHDGIFVARNLKRRTPKKYVVKMPPVIVPVGKNWALFEYKKICLSGLIASLIRRVADFVGYSDILPLGQALGVWSAQMIKETNYYTSIKAPEDTSQPSD
jgi:NADH dehydrogenase